MSPKSSKSREMRSNATTPANFRELTCMCSRPLLHGTVPFDSTGVRRDTKGTRSQEKRRGGERPYPLPLGGLLDSVEHVRNRLEWDGLTLLPRGLSEEVVGFLHDNCRSFSSLGNKWSHGVTSKVSSCFIRQHLPQHEAQFENGLETVPCPHTSSARWSCPQSFLVHTKTGLSSGTPKPTHLIS